MRMPARPGTHTDARARTHRQMCTIYCFSSATMVRERTPALHNAYIACLVFPSFDKVSDVFREFRFITYVVYTP